MTQWTIQIEGDRLTLSRPGRARMDVSVCTDLYTCHLSRRRLAHQVRQDIWRACQKTRGFSPVVAVTRRANGMQIRAGAQVDGPLSPRLSQTIAAVLACPKTRARWQRHAGRRQAA